jgi:hypothetical protein
MPIFFHGTRRADATAMAGPPGTIDVSIGSGEFGQGFYTQDSCANALTWVQHKFPAAEVPCLLEVDIDDKEYANLAARIITMKQAIRLTQRLRAAGATGTHTEGVDVVVGPLNGSNWIEQQKFESQTAETLLNGHHTQRRVI